jgi:hypothetical protein
MLDDRNPSNGHRDANIDLWPAGAWGSGELASIREVCTQMGMKNVSGQISRDIRGVELQVVIAFVAGAIAAGFFEALGSDLYAKSKTRLRDLLLKKKDSARQESVSTIRVTFEYPPHVARFLKDKTASDGPTFE